MQEVTYTTPDVQSICEHGASSQTNSMKPLWIVGAFKVDNVNLLRLPFEERI